MKKPAKVMATLGLFVTLQLAYSSEVTDTFVSGDTLTAAKLNNMTSAINDNDSRITTNDTRITTLESHPLLKRAFPPDAAYDIELGYGEGTLWIDTDKDQAYVSVDSTISAAVWKNITPKTYAIGDLGPAGGWVFYATSDGLHGLEAAPADLSLAPYGCVGTLLSVPASGGEGYGAGRLKTDAINTKCSEASTAARLAEDYVSPSGYFDWYLPSSYELDKVLLNLGGPNSATYGLQTALVYWSANEVDASQSYLITNNSASGPTIDTGAKSVDAGVRVIRAF